MTADIGTDIDKAIEILSEGGLVSIPTETVYGLAANAFDTNAVLKVFNTKNRPSFDPLITHVKDSSALESLTMNIPQKASKLIDHFLARAINNCSSKK